MAIETRGLTKHYATNSGVFDLDLSVAGGEIFGFLGPNGAGKTTAIRLLLNLIRPDRGHATVFGQDCQSDASSVHQMTGYLPGEFALDPKLTGRQLLVYLANLRGGVDWNYVADLTKRLALDLNRPFGDYSRGNKQKVGLLQAFMHRPRVLILDEPTGGLDPLNQETVLDLVREVNAAGTTVFFSSHVLSEVEQVCHTIGFIRQGRLLRSGPVHEVLGSRLHSVEVECQEAPNATAFEVLTGVSQVEVRDHKVSFLVSGEMGEAISVASSFGIKDLVSKEPSLAETFRHLYQEDGP